MYRSSFLIDRRGMHILYYSLFLPYIMYCAKVWGNTYTTNVQCLVILQKRVIRLLCGAKRLDHTTMLFYNLHILKVPDIVKLKTAIITLKAVHNLLQLNVQQFFSIYESVFSTQQECNFIQKYACTSLKSMCISVKGVKLWNALDSSLISCRSVHQFKKYYTDKVLNSYVLSS